MLDDNGNRIRRGSVTIMETVKPVSYTHLLIRSLTVGTSCIWELNNLKRAVDIPIAFLNQEVVFMPLLEIKAV